MAKSLLSTIRAIDRAMKQAEREAIRREKAAERAHTAALREEERARKAEERANAQAERAKAADRRRLQKEAKAAHVKARVAEVEARNAELLAIYDDLDNLLGATLEVDDYVDLETLRRTPANTPFDRTDLEIPTPPPAPIIPPAEPELILPKAKGIFFRKKNHREATAKAKALHAKAQESWSKEMMELEKRRNKATQKYEETEQNRIDELGQERTRFAKEISEHNRALDDLIANLSYGTPEAVQEYVSIVVSNSVHPDHFPIESTFTFDPLNSELNMVVSVPPPSAAPSIKAYKYKKVADEIATTKLSQKDMKERYAGAVHQIALRSLHEVFEADRRGLIKTISLEVGTTDTMPETGVDTYISFIAVAAERELFNGFDLARVSPAETLKLLGAAVSKNPHGLVATNATGVRRS